MVWTALVGCEYRKKLREVNFLYKDTFKNIEYTSCKYCWGWQSECPCEEDIFDSSSLETIFSMFMSHCSSNTRWHDMCGGYRKMEKRCCLNSSSCHERCDRCLGVGEFFFTDFFTDCYHNTLPSYHRTKTERDRYHDDYPVWDCLCTTGDSRNIIHRWEKCNQYEHRETYTFLSIIRSMSKAHEDTWSDESCLDPCFWILVPETSWMFEKIMILDVKMQ